MLGKVDVAAAMRIVAERRIEQAMKDGKLDHLRLPFDSIGAHGRSALQIYLLPAGI